MRRKQQHHEVAPGDAGAVFTIPELAQRWRVNRHTIVAAIKAGRLQAFKPDKRHYRIRKDEALRFEQQQAMAVAS